MAIRIEFLSSWRGISNTHRAGPCQGRTSHHFVQLRSRGFDWCSIPKGDTLLGDRDSNPPLVSRQCPQAHPYYLQDATYHSIAGLNCITRLRGRNDLSGQLSVRLRSTWLKDVQQSLNDSDGYRSTPKTSMPCCFTIVIPPSLISFY
jgi:hypothetical protein